MTVAPPQPLVPPTARRSRRRRRPSGAPPPLPRSLGFTGRGWLVFLGLLILWIAVTLVSRPARTITDRADASILRTVARLRADPLTDVMRGIDRVASGWTMSIIAGLLTIALIAFRRWRHLFTFAASVLVLQVLKSVLNESFARPRPYDVTNLGSWRGYSLPSSPVAVCTVIAVSIVYSMVVPGRSRSTAKIIVGVAVAVVVLARLYLGEDHPFDAVVAVACGVAIPLNAFRFFTPNDVFPVSYGKHKTAHLDVGGRRGEAIRRAVEDQLGVTVLDVRPVGLGGSGGSTPLRMRIAGDPDTYVFGKLYAMNHVRADRWYKLGRTILYGRLEDETPFQSVRRLVQYEDYALRLMRDVGIRTAAPLGIVELTPEREYLLVTEFFDGAVEIGEAEVDEAIVDEGLALIRQLWDAGLAHRDIKPANLMVKDGHVILIDVAFAQVRPSPWREAIDLANMMLVLAVRTDAELVYSRALQFFTPDEIAEAFAAARGVASPTQLRTVMKQDGRDLLAQFRALAPERRPISLQRWSVRRVILGAALIFGSLFSVQIYAQLFTPADLPVSGRPDCETSNLMILMAQSVPEATQLPCLASIPAGWEFESVEIREGEAQFWLSSDDAGHRAVEVALQSADRCDTAGALEVPSDGLGTRRLERPVRLRPTLLSTRFYLFPGGCITYRMNFDEGASTSLIFTVDSAVDFQQRQLLVAEVRRRTEGLRLCGVGTRACPGGDS